ncbi:DUF2057 family protein [Lentisphaera profundi]|uniref:DUF2057 family protein n=1 Tax=Lentisphaera profundi TaxID=1658616 RepID=A0ABY7VVB7_9BACT|nr:DUF2057 family protein [Lentisphaera profundi]WDE98165.1 DUF2057 family protein [Lentisphaera profundi]
MPLIILRSSVLALILLFLFSCASQKEVNVSGSPFGRAPTAKLIVPSHIVVKSVNKVPVNMPLLANGSVTLLMGEGNNEIEAYFDSIYDELNQDDYSRVSSDSFYAILSHVVEDEVYSFDLTLPDNKDKARARLADKSNLGNIVRQSDAVLFPLVPADKSRKSIRDYMRENDPYVQMKHWWDKANSEQKERFKQEVLHK